MAGALTSEAAVKPGLLQTKALGDASSDLVYTPIAPCRIVDTVSVGGAIALLIALERIVQMTQPGSMVLEVALQAIECYRERDAMILQEEKIIPRSVPSLRIAGIAS